MTAPHLAHATPWGRMYSRQVGGEPLVPSITTVQGMSPDLANPNRPEAPVGVRPRGGTLGVWKSKIVQEATAAYLRQSQDLELPQHTHITQAVSRALAQGKARAEVGVVARNAILCTPDIVANQAAERGDRVHQLAEAIGNWQLGIDDRAVVDRCLEALRANGEQDYGEVLIDWWRRWEVRAVATESTVWNHELGVAGTLDIVFSSGGKLWVADFKTKGLTPKGRSKPVHAKVGTQLINALHAEELNADPEAGTWIEWPHRQPHGLLALGVSTKEVIPSVVSPETYDLLWRVFQNQRRAWQDFRELSEAKVLSVVRPPSSAAAWPKSVRVGLDDIAPN